MKKQLAIATLIGLIVLGAAFVGAKKMQTFNIVTDGLISASGTSTYSSIPFSAYGVEDGISVYLKTAGGGSGVTVYYMTSNDNSNFVVHGRPIISDAASSASVYAYWPFGSGVTEIPLAPFVKFRVTEYGAADVTGITMSIVAQTNR